MSAQPASAHDDIAVLRAAAAAASSTAESEKIYRRIAALAEPADVKVAWLGNHTLAPIERLATVAAFARGVHLESWVGDFGQHFQAVLDKSSQLAQFVPDAILLSLSLRTLAPSLVSGARSAEEKRAEIERVLEHVEQWVSAAKASTGATLFVTNFPRPPNASLGLADAKSRHGDARLYAQLNERLAARYFDDPAVHVLDAAHAIATAGAAHSWQPRMQHLAKIEWSGPGLAAVAELAARALHALVRPARKCIAVDLDGTLWGGILGEDGVEGVKIGPGDPVGEAHAELQHALLDMKSRGIVLAIASKNNPEDVEEAFAALEMPLRRDDFAAAAIGWEPKHVGLRSIAETLNIGLDSIVFVDDSPAECELIRQMVPEVEVVALGSEPAEHAELLRGRWDFDKLMLTEDDARKTELYRENERRHASQAAASDLTAYLRSLETRVVIRSASEPMLPRLHQLFSKTNQFNLTTKRYGLAEIGRLAGRDDVLLESIEVEDRFGRLGIVGLYLVKIDGTDAEIDSFILSCRALGREVETAMCNRVKERALELGIETLHGRYAPTKKNKPAARFYDAQQFALTREDADGTRLYEMRVTPGAIVPCPAVAIVVEPVAGSSTSADAVGT